MANTTVKDVIFDNGTTIRITENTARKESSVVVMPLYSMDSDNTDTFDYGGVVRTFTLQGITVSEDLATLKEWIESAEALQQGHQDTADGYPVNFIDDLRGTVKVKIMSFDSTMFQGDTVSATWTIKLVESSENA